MTHRWIAVFVDAALDARGAAGALARSEPRKAADLLAVFEAAPIERLGLQNRRGERSEAFGDEFADDRRLKLHIQRSKLPLKEQRLGLPQACLLPQPRLLQSGGEFAPIRLLPPRGRRFDALQEHH